MYDGGPESWFRSAINGRAPGSRDDFFHPPDNPVFQHHLDPMRMRRRFRQEPLDDAFRELSRTLILLLNDAHAHARLDVRSDVAAQAG